MPVTGWCGNECEYCELECNIRNSVPCLPDCYNINNTVTQRNLRHCISTRCEYLKPEEKSFDGRRLYDYIAEHYSLGGTAGRLINNAIQYVELQGFSDPCEAHSVLSALLGGAFGIEMWEIELYRADELEELDEEED